MTRRTLQPRVITGLALALATGLTGPLCGQAPAGAWVQFRGTQALTGVSADTPPAELTVLWSYDTGDVIESSPAIVGGVVYVGAGDGMLLALDFDTGALRWSYEAGGLIGESSPAVANGIVYVGDLDGVLHAVNAADGTPRWTFETEAEIRSSPVIVDGLVLVGSYDAHLYAVDADTGALRWKMLTQGMVHATPAVQAGLTFVAGCDGFFRAVRVEDGTEAYLVDAGAYTAASPVLDGDRAYFGTFNNEVLALDLARREVYWRYADPDRQFPFYSSAALADGRVIVGGRDRRIHAIDAETGEAVWTFATRARVDSSPVVAGGHVYVGSSDGRFYVLDADTGTELWAFDVGADIVTSPAIADGRVAVGAYDGILYVLG